MTPRAENARIIILVPNEGLNDSSRGNCRIVILVPNEGLNDSSRGNCKNNNAAVGRQGDTT